MSGTPPPEVGPDDNVNVVTGPDGQPILGPDGNPIVVSAGDDSVLGGGPPTGAPVSQANAPQPIGGFASLAPVRVDRPGDSLNQSYVGAGDTPNGYYAGDEFSILSSLTTEDLVRLQEQMVAVGLATNITYGQMDDRTVTSMRSLLAMSNRSRTPWQQTLSQIAANPPDEEQFEPDPYIAPDYATLAQNVKDQFMQRLGREPEEAELEQLVGELRGWDRQAYDQQQEMARAEFEGDQPALTTAVDPLARFQEHFDTAYSGELAFIEDKETAAEARTALQTTANTVSAMAEGGG